MMSGMMAVPSRGRPRLSGSVRQIRLRSSVFELWNLKKSTLGFEGATNSGRANRRADEGTFKIFIETQSQ